MDLKLVFSDSLAIFKRNAMSLVVGGLILCVVAVACLSGPAVLLGISLKVNDNGQLDFASLGAQLLWVYVVTAALVICIVVPLSYGLLSVSLKFATEGAVGGPGRVFSGLRRWKPVALFALLKTALYSVIAVGLAIPVGILAAILTAMFGWFGLILGYLLFLAPFAYFEIVWLYTPAFLYDREAGLFEAMRESRRLVARQGFVATLVCIILPAGIALGVAFVVGFLLGALGLDPQVISIGGQVIEYALFTPWLYAVIVVMYMQAGGRSADLEAALAGRPTGSRPPLPYGLPLGPASATPFPSATPAANPFPSAKPSAAANPFPSATPSPPKFPPAAP